LAAWALAACADMPIQWPLTFAQPTKIAEMKPPPGAINEAVTQANVRRTICRPGWLASLQPPATFVHEAKARLVKEHGIADGDAAKFELDFLIPIALGGHPRKPENLWLVPSEGAWSARTKDRLEAKLRHLVCSGEITLGEARDAVRSDWKMAARYYLSDRELLEPMR
jgi:hypothetical protein